MLKLPACILGAIISSGGSVRLYEVLWSELPTYSTLKCAVPAFAYTLQGNLIFVATANLETPTFQVTYQTKTLFTALFSVLILGRRLELSQWLALVLLFCGTVAATDLVGSSDQKSGSGQASSNSATENRGLGLGAVLIAAVLSSSSSVYFEMMLKHEPMRSCREDVNAASGDLALWLRNLQLGLFALPLAAVAAFAQDSHHIYRVGAFAGFDWVVWTIVLTNGFGGLLVAATMKYADNIVKCFAAALAIITGMLLSVPLFNVPLSPIFLVGAASTVSATMLYARVPDLSLSCAAPPPRDSEDEEAVLMEANSARSSPRLLESPAVDAKS